MTVIYSVEKVDLSFEKPNPPNLVVTAVGSVTTGGWKGFSLSLVIYVTPPADGVQEFSFEGIKPSGPVTEAIEGDKEASARISGIDRLNYWGPNQELKGIRVKASSNSVLTEF